MSSRDAILGRIRGSVAGDPALAMPPPPEVWLRTGPSTGEMADRFARELADVAGETIRAASMDDARKKLAELVQEGKWTRVGALDRPLCREATSSLPAGSVAWAAPDWTPRSMADLDAGIIEADYLLADTGSAMIACGRAEERLLCYLPPVSIVVAAADRLREHLPAAWTEIAPRVADPALRGEFVFITGPSRTADIEKILILGVHGPKRLIVLLVG
jgi:L-lactate dehydrogenase complex protein LldG